MPRKLVAGNGNLLVTFDEKNCLRDFYYPHVGMEDHTTFGHFHRVGVSVDGVFSWIHDDDWNHEIDYEYETLVGKSSAFNEKLQIRLRFFDFVYTTHDVLFRRIFIENLAGYDRELKIFFNFDFHLYGNKALDTAIYEPKFNAVLHYRQNRYFLVNGRFMSGEGVHEYSVGKSHYNGKEGTWRDAEDGKLEKNPVEQGSVDSTISFVKTIPAQKAALLYQWISCGINYHEVEKSEKRINELSPEVIYEHTRDFWRKWVNKQQFDFADLPENLVKNFKRSLLIIRTQIDNQGAIIAANDSDIMIFNKDTYSYMWPRDGALVAQALSKAGYAKPVRDFLKFCKNLITDEGYIFHKYNSDGSLGSSWHPKVFAGQVQLPIQEDETALLLVAMNSYHKRFKEIEFIQENYNDFVLKIGNFLSSFIDGKTNLPLPTYDLWEEQRGVFTYTAACTYAGLVAAANMAFETGHLADGKRFENEAQKLKVAILAHLYSSEHKRFLKKVQLGEQGVEHADATVDASLAFIWMMGLLPADDFRVVETMHAIKQHLWVPTPIGGIARYTNDNYHINQTRNLRSDIPGNPWIITTLWYANWQIETAKSAQDLSEPLRLINWVLKNSSSAGIMPEQLDPLSGKPLSVAPLTWSHATFVETVMNYRHKLYELGLCDNCEIPQFR
jgi:oligosaccharide amylase